MIFGDITTGASDDLRHAMEIARALVMKYGMSEAISTCGLGRPKRADILGQRFYGGKKLFGRSGKEIDAEITKIINNSKKEYRRCFT